MRRSSLVFVVLLFSSSVFARSTILVQVTDAITSNALEGIQIVLWNEASEHIESAISDPSGNHSLIAPAQGNYYVFKPEFGVLAPYLPKVYPDTFCNTNVCDPTPAGEAVPVAGTPVSGIDFSLENGFTSSGTVLDDSLNPVDGITMCIHRRSDPFAGMSVGDAPDGTYTTNNALPAGDHYAAYVASSGLHTQ